MKSNKESNALKAEVDTMNAKLGELTDDELAQVSGGKRDLTCSVAAVSCNDLNAVPVQNPVQSLQGKVAGMVFAVADVIDGGQ